MMTLGQAVKRARKSKGWTQERLGAEAGLGQATISALENDELGARLDAYMRTLIKVAEALGAPPILAHHCETCPIRTHLFQGHFGHLLDRRHDLAAVAKQLREQLEATLATLDELAGVVSADDSEGPANRERTRRLFERIVDFEQGIRVLKFQMMLDELL